MYLRNVISLKVTLLNVRIVILLLAFVHLIVTAVVTLSIDTTVDDDPKVRAYYYVRWKLITCWFNLVTLAYLPSRLYCEWKANQGEGNNALVKRLNHINDVIFTGILFPIVLISDVTFWIVYNKDPGLIAPPRVFHYLPNWAQHSLHTVSFFVILLDIALTPRRRPKTLIPRLAVLLAFSLSYTSMIFSNYLRGEMIYQLFEAMSGFQLLVMFAFLNIIILVLFVVQWVAIDYLWGSKPVEKIA